MLKYFVILLLSIIDNNTQVVRAAGQQCKNNEILVTTCGEVSGWVTMEFMCNCTFNDYTNIGGWNPYDDEAFISDIWQAYAPWRYQMIDKNIPKDYEESVVVQAKRDGDTFKEAYLRKIRIGAMDPYTMMNPIPTKPGVDKNMLGEFSISTDWNKNNYGGHMGLAPYDQLFISGKIEIPLILDRLENFTATHNGCTIVFNNLNRPCPEETVPEL